MKNKLKIIIFKSSFFFLIVINFTSLNAQRNIIWTHGLAETSAAWQRYVNDWNWGGKYPTTAINNVNTFHHNNNGMVNTANDVKGVIDFELGINNTNPNNIGIAQGVAGLAYRHIDGTTSSNNKRFGGFITLGTSQNGVHFLDAIQDGDLLAYHNDANNKLTGIGNADNFSLNGKIWDLDDFRNAAENFALQHFSSNLTGSNFNGTTTDLTSSSNFISNLPSNYSKPTISIYGNENADSKWRLLSSLDETPHSLGLNSVGGEDWLIAAKKMKRRYGRRVAAHVGIGILLVGVTAAATEVGGVVGLAGGGYLIYEFSIQPISQAIKARNWFNDVDTKWRKLTGAIRTQVNSYTYNGMTQACLNNIVQYGWGWYYGSPQNQANCWANITTVISTQYINEIDDGLIPKSLTEMPNATNVTSLEATGANHFELYNHPGVSLRFDQAFNGQHDPFFKIQ